MIGETHLTETGLVTRRANMVTEQTGQTISTSNWCRGTGLVCCFVVYTLYHAN